MRRLAAIGLAAAIAAIAVILIVTSGDGGYILKMRVADANGLRDGSPVVVGGVVVGSVHLDAHFSAVDITLTLDRSHAPVGRNATAAIVAQNVLGQKQISLTVGDPREAPAPSGYVIPSGQTSASTDLDQLLSTLDSPTRARLVVLVNELGTAFAGRKLDFRSFIGQVVPALESGDNVLGQLAQENQRLGTLLGNTDSFIASLAASRVQIADGLDALGRATQTFAGRQDALRSTLRLAPGTLATARSFLGDLQQTTVPLASAARLLTATAPSLTAVLDRLAPFTAAATPALQAATDNAAPALRALGDSSTSNVSALLPTVTDASALVRDQVPAVGDALNGSVDNLLALLHNWSRAIQFRDGISHVFRGEATLAPSMYSRLLANLGIGLPKPAASARQVASRAAARPASLPPVQPPPPAASPPARGAPTPPLGLSGAVTSVDSLLRYLLGP
jgi:phospholipid/cholesterol/gamma-HCH transport system substrate-binding protein